MGKVIILEGPDGSGKTTLAKQLVSMGYRYHHEGPPPLGQDLVQYYLNLLGHAIDAPVDTVFDRLWLGERIYGPLIRGVDRLGHEGQKLFMRIKTSRQVLQIMCLPKLETVRENYKEKIKDPRDFLKNENLNDQVYDKYLMWSYLYGVTEDFYDYENKTHSATDVHNRVSRIQPLPAGCVGSKFATHLFIGDCPNHPSVNVPFHSTIGSSGYLNSAISLSGITEPQIALTNISGPWRRTKNDIVATLNRLPQLEHVFLLGNIAQVEYQKLKVDSWYNTHNLPHPSYLKRFHGNDPQLMADMIRKELE